MYSSTTQNGHLKNCVVNQNLTLIFGHSGLHFRVCSPIGLIGDPTYKTSTRPVRLHFATFYTDIRNLFVHSHVAGSVFKANKLTLNLTKSRLQI